MLRKIGRNLLAPSSALVVGGVGVALSQPKVLEKQPSATWWWRLPFGVDSWFAPHDSLLSSSSVTTNPNTESVVESATGIHFPLQLRSPTSATAAPLYFAGAGVRVKYSIINVYAVGAYFDAKNSYFCGNRTSPPGPDVPSAFRIVLAGDVSRIHFIQGMEKSIRPHLQVQGDALTKLFRLLEEGLPASLPKGLKLDLHLNRDKLTVHANDAILGSAIDSAVLCNAISEVYLGQEPISPAAKAQVVAGIAKRFTEKGEYICLEGTTAIL